MKPEKNKTSISIDNDLYKKVKELGDLEHRSFSQQVAKMLQDRLSEYDKVQESR